MEGAGAFGYLTLVTQTILSAKIDTNKIVWFTLELKNS
jgi:hypothetical protein